MYYVYIQYYVICNIVYFIGCDKRRKNNRYPELDQLKLKLKNGNKVGK